MSHYSTVPEYTVEESEKTHPTENKLLNFVRDLQVDIQVLYQELTKLEGFSGRIADDIRVLELSVSGQELQD